MSRCYACSQENCSNLKPFCSCSCHNNISTMPKDNILTAAEAKSLYNKCLLERVKRTTAWITEELVALSISIKEAAQRGELILSKSYQRAISDSFESPPIQMGKLAAALEDKGYTVKWEETGKQTNRNNSESRVYKISVAWSK